MSMSDSTLTLTAGHDDRAFAEIVERYSGLIRRVAYRTLGGTADVDDVVQETFLAAWTHRDTVVDRESMAGWLATTARRRSYDRLRSAAARHRADLVDDESDTLTEPAAEDAVCRSALASAASQVLEAMPELQRRCWLLRQLDELSYDEIGHRLRLPRTTVRGRIARARAALATELAPWR